MSIHDWLGFERASDAFLTANAWYPYEDNRFLFLLRTRNAMQYCELCVRFHVPVLGGMMFRVHPNGFVEGDGYGWSIEGKPAQTLESYTRQSLDESVEFFDSTLRIKGGESFWFEVTPADEWFVRSHFANGTYRRPDSWE